LILEQAMPGGAVKTISEPCPQAAKLSLLASGWFAEELKSERTVSPWREAGSHTDARTVSPPQSLMEQFTEVTETTPGCGADMEKRSHAVCGGGGAGGAGGTGGGSGGLGGRGKGGSPGGGGLGGLGRVTITVTVPPQAPLP
jgi:hypothetical protein